MKTLFITFSVIIVIAFAGAIIIGDADAKAVAKHIHARATYKAPIMNADYKEIKMAKVNYYSI